VTQNSTLQTVPVSTPITHAVSKRYFTQALPGSLFNGGDAGYAQSLNPFDASSFSASSSPLVPSSPRSTNSSDSDRSINTPTHNVKRQKSQKAGKVKQAPYLKNKKEYAFLFIGNELDTLSQDVIKDRIRKYKNNASAKKSRENVKKTIADQKETLAEQAKAIETAKIQYAELRKVNIKLAHQCTTLLAERNKANTQAVQFFNLAQKYQQQLLAAQKKGTTP
jgi:hypothetical protein